MTTALLTQEHHWVCPNCDFTDVTHEARAHSRMHSCRGMVGMSMPMVPDGTKAKVELIERGDYINGDAVRTDMEGRPWMAAVTTRDEGQDCAVFAGHATGNRRQE